MPDGRPKALQDARGVRTEYHYYDDGGPLSEVLVGGRRLVALGYDQQRRLAQVAHDGGAAEEFDYDDGGRLTRYRRASRMREEEVAFSYDGLGRLAAASSPALGRIAVVPQPDGVTFTRDREVMGSARHDTAGRLIASTGPGGARAAYDYGPDGRLRRVEAVFGGAATSLKAVDATTVVRRGPAGEMTRFTLASGRLASVEEAYGARTGYAYDEEGRLQRVSLANGRCLEYVYDGKGQLVEQREQACGR